MKRFVGMVVLVVVLSTQVQASETRAMNQAIFSHMTATYMCRDALGGLAHYQAARTIATNLFGRMIGQREGVLMVDYFEKKTMDDPRTAQSYTNAAKCFEVVNDGLHRIEVERAKLGL